MHKIVVLDGRDVPNPEDLAMLQALYSRSPNSVTEHLEKVRTAGSSRFVEKYLVQYGHKSIGDCGTTTLFLENVSLLAAKAVQDSPLYNGQEASTRYLDMSKQGLVDPRGTPGSAAILAGWMRLYSRALEALVPDLKSRFPRKEGEKEAVWEKAIKAKAFDIARGFLPAAVRTYVAWHATIRHAGDRLKELRHHPLTEVRDLADGAHAKLLERYPSSFAHKRHEAEEGYVDSSMEEFAYYDGDVPEFAYKSFLDLESLSSRRCRRMLEFRPPRSELHQRLRAYGAVRFELRLDFGSFRDLQRQRSAVMEMPLLTTRLGFHPWYLEQLPESFREEAHAAIRAQEVAISTLDVTPEVRQYYVAIGYVVPVVMSCNLPSAVYVAELRSSQTVHPTLRVQAQRMGDALKEAVPFLAMHHDRTPDEWSVRRGTQDIVKRETTVA